MRSIARTSVTLQRTEMTGQDIYQLKVTLLGTRPPIWRRLLISGDITLAQLHDVLQIAMGWENSHMHQFRIGQRRFGQAEPAAPFTRSPRVESERTAHISSVLREPGAKMIYLYDFGDGWEHDIVLEKCLPAGPHFTCSVCTGGEQACPPEDCGGTPGYLDLLEAINNPDDESLDELRDWAGEDFNPGAFSIDEVNRRLSPKPRRSKPPAR